MNSTQQIVYGSARSAVTPVTSGVIQGSSLGPCLFFAFITIFTKKVKICKLYLFADGSKMVSSARTVADYLLTHVDLDAIQIRSVENQLLLSLSNCVCLHYGFKSSHHKYVINEARLKEANSCTDWSVMRSINFSYATHVHSVCMKANRMCGMIFTLLKTKTIELKIKIFLTYIRPIVLFVAPV